MPTVARPSFRPLIDAFQKEARQAKGFPFHIRVRELAAGRTVLELPAEQQRELLFEALAWQINAGGTYEGVALLETLMDQQLSFTGADLEQLIGLITPLNGDGLANAVPTSSILRAVEAHALAEGMSDSLAKAVRQLVARLRKVRRSLCFSPEFGELLKRVQGLLPEAPDPATSFELTTDEAWTRCLRQALAGLDGAARPRWHALLAHCATATASKPAKKWLQQAEALIQAIGTEGFASLAAAVLAEVGKPGTPEITPVYGHPQEGDPTQVHEAHSDLLRGLVWCTGLVDSDALTTAVGDAAEVCFKKLPSIGPRAPKIGNACLWALANRSSTAAVAQLSRLKTRAKHVSIRKQLGKALDTAAEKTGLSATELEEVSVPTCGLTAVGEHRQQLGDYTALLQVTDGKAAVSWIKPDGKTQASVPAAVKAMFAGELKALKRTEKEIDKLLPAQRDRLEQLFRQERSWPLGEFRARFLDHPLVGALARRLIWHFTTGTHAGAGIWHDGRIIDERSRALDWLGEEARVSLWHPLNATVEQVQAWRQWLEGCPVRQPFKQAHREIYLLTDAERQTGVYSNRFAAHILKQHQFSALCQQRGWGYRLQGEWDSHNTPTLDMPAWELRAEFWVEPAREDGPLLERGDLSHGAVYLFLSTDQVRFYRGQEPTPLPLADVPPLAFSEVLRDVDLFIGVASVGNDPNWADGGRLGRHRAYWESYSFGELFPSAQTRKAVLERLVPRLKIAGRCSFSDRFLVVRGDLRTYKIHLGSGNVLMSPDDHYLCIVPKQGAAAGPGGKVFLPFEGDPMLSIILSKALLLAEDKKIKDPTILSQMNARPGVPVA
jgi:hypothetical protein